MPVSPELQKAIDAAKAGDRASARKILKQVLREDQSNETAWFLYAQVTDTPEHAIASLKKVLELNPYNERAKQQLAQLAPKEEPKPDPNAPWDYNKHYEKKRQEKGVPEEPIKGNKKWLWTVLGIGAGVIFLLCLAAFFITRSLLPDKPLPTYPVVLSSPTPTADMCDCMQAQSYMERTTNRLNIALKDMETVQVAVQNTGVAENEMPSYIANAKSFYNEQLAESPPPCLEQYNKKMVQFFWAWDQSLSALKNGDSGAMQAFFDGLAAQGEEVALDARQIQSLIISCPMSLPEMPTAAPPQ